MDQCEQWSFKRSTFNIINCAGIIERLNLILIGTLSHLLCIWSSWPKARPKASGNTANLANWKYWKVPAEASPWDGFATSEGRPLPISSARLRRASPSHDQFFPGPMTSFLSPPFILRTWLDCATSTTIWCAARLKTPLWAHCWYDYLPPTNYGMFNIVSVTLDYASMSSALVLAGFNMLHSGLGT